MPVSTLPPPSKHRRRDPARHVSLYLDEQPLVNRRSITVGIIGTILFHLLFLFGIPRSYLAVKVEPPASTARDIPLELQTEEEPQPPEPRFTETNPEAPENIPDRTDNFAARNQQAANPVPPDQLSPDQTPAREGEDDVPTEKFLSGELNPQITVAPAPPTPEVQPQPEANPPARQDPLAGFEQDKTEAEEGTGSTQAEASTRPMPVTEKVEGEDNESEDTRPRMIAIDPSPEQLPAPQPRPRLPRTTPGPIKRQPAGVTQTGSVSVNANFSQYGEYLERVVEAVTQRWHGLCASRSYSESGTHVVLRFKLTRDGMVRGLETLDNTSQALGILLCRSAVEGGQSYGMWSQDMVAVLGSEQTVTFVFHYR